MSETKRRQRGVAKVWEATPRPGRGPHLRAAPVLEPGRWREFDPFLLMMEDWFQSGTFDFHPHRGIETVTFVIEGRLKHEDNQGGYGILEPGDVQWMTAGGGILHSEDPLPGETVHSLQLWVNLPRADKMSTPRYQDLKAGDMPLRTEPGATVRIFSGTSGGIAAPTRNVVPITFVELSLEAGASVAQELPADYNGFVYVLSGSGAFGAAETRGTAGQVLWLESLVSPWRSASAAAENAGKDGASGEDGAGEETAASEVTVRADEPLRALLVAGRPIGEPVVAQGPFVMNTAGEIKQAFDDFYAGKFGARPNPR